MGRENRAAEEQAENLRIQRFEKRRSEVEKMKQEVKLHQDELKIRQDIAKLNASTTRRGQDIQETLGEARNVSAQLYQEALGAESAARTDRIMRELSFDPLGPAFQEAFDDFLKSSLGRYEDVEDLREAAAISAAKSLLGKGATPADVNKILARMGYSSIITEITPEELVRYRARNSKE